MITNLYRLLLTLSVAAGTLQAMDTSPDTKAAVSQLLALSTVNSPKSNGDDASTKVQADNDVPALIRPIAIKAPNPKLQQQIEALKEAGWVKNGKSVYAPGKFSCNQCNDYVGGDSIRALNTHIRLKHAQINAAAAILTTISQSPKTPFSPRSSSAAPMNTENSNNAAPQMQGSASNNAIPESKKRKNPCESEDNDKAMIVTEQPEQTAPKRQRVASPQILSPVENSVPSNEELYKAIAANSASEVTSLLARKADANALRWGNVNNSMVYETALGVAAKVGNSAIIKKLLEAKAVPNITTSHPLINAVKQGSLDAVFMLLNAGAHSNSCTHDGQTAATVAAQGNPMLKDAMIALMQAHQQKNNSNNSNNAHNNGM